MLARPSRDGLKKGFSSRSLAMTEAWDRPTRGTTDQYTRG